VRRNSPNVGCSGTLANLRMFRSTLSAVSQQPEPTYCSTPLRAWKARPVCRLLPRISTSRRDAIFLRSANRTERGSPAHLPAYSVSGGRVHWTTCSTERGGPRTSLVRSISLPRFAGRLEG